MSEKNEPDGSGASAVPNAGAKGTAPDAGEAGTESGRGEGAEPTSPDRKGGDERGTVATSPEADAEKAAEAELGKQFDDLQAELGTLNERHLRLAAEFQNYRRRAEVEMAGTWARAQADLVRRFLEVLDDLQRVSGLDPEDDNVSVQSIVEGVDLVERKFGRTLEDAGVEVVDPVGERFDPATMEAVMRVPTTSEEEDGTVAQVLQKGYVIHGHLIRPARVSVSQRD